jgi:hypothetical protein
MPAGAAAAAGYSPVKAKKGTSEDGDKWSTLIDLTPLQAVPKAVRPISKQQPTESRRLWDSVTNRLLRKEYGEATRAKHVIEQRQRDEAAERKRRGVECVLYRPLFFPPCVLIWTGLSRFVPRYFEKDIQSGVPTLTQAGKDALNEEIKYEDEDKDADVGGRDGGDDDDNDSSAPSPTV